MKECVLVLHNIRSIHNVGSIFRTADAAGVSRIILSGYTPTPLDRFNDPRKDFIKVSLGAEKSVPWSTVKTLRPTLTRLKKDGYTILALEQSSVSTPLFSYKSKKDERAVLIVGNEVRGIAKGTLALADHIVEIPMRGKKESLNVSVAAGVALFALTK